MSAFNWTCPFCNHKQAVTEAQNQKSQIVHVHPRNIYGWGIIVEIHSIGCANDNCMNVQLGIDLYQGNSKDYSSDKGELIKSWLLLPESFAKPQPDYIPEHIVADYNEACKIRDLSPKASATLARRCIQGIIRDFCKIQKNSLYSEIEELKNRVENNNAPENVLQDTVNALHHVRSIGNIGAHMAKDVNLIIDIEPNEVQKLIELIELLFDEWYVHRHDRQQRLQELKEIADKKQEERSI